MNEKLRTHINMLFEGAPQTRRALDLKEELFANLIERYNDLVASGVSEEDAYKNAVANIGDVSELINNLKENDILNNFNHEDARKKTALVLTISVGLYFLAFLIPMIITFLSHLSPVAAFFMMIGIAAIPTCLLVYHYTSLPRYHKFDDSIVEEFKEWSSNTGNKKRIRGAISGILWTLTVFIYLIFSFLTHDWYISWLIFILAACIECIITLIFRLKETK